MKIAAGFLVAVMISFLLGLGFVWRRNLDTSYYQHYSYGGPILVDLVISLGIGVIVLLIIFLSKDD